MTLGTSLLQGYYCGSDGNPVFFYKSQKYYTFSFIYISIQDLGDRGSPQLPVLGYSQ